MIKIKKNKHKMRRFEEELRQIQVVQMHSDLKVKE